MSLSMAGTRELGKTESIFRILFYYFALSTLFTALPLYWGWQNLTPHLWILIIGIGLSAALYQYFLTIGFKNASASKVSPFIYCAVILSGIFDWIFWKIVPDIFSYLGVILVIVGAIWCVRIQGGTQTKS